MSTLREELQQLGTEIKRDATKNKRRIQEILTIVREHYPRNDENDETEMDLMPEFPLAFVDDYVQFNERLKTDEVVRKCFVSIF